MFKRLYAWLFLLLVAIAAFAAPVMGAGFNPLADRGHLSVSMSGNMTAREVASIHQAGQIWNTLIGRPVVIFTPNTDTADYVITSVLGYDDPKTLAVCYYPYNTRYISYLEYLRFDPVLHRRVMIHEMGHMLGLKHSDNKQSVMFPAIGTADYPTVADVAEVRKRWAF